MAVSQIQSSTGRKTRSGTQQSVGAMKFSPDPDDFLPESSVQSGGVILTCANSSSMLQKLMLRASGRIRRLAG
jgi:hypothetical protein